MSYSESNNIARIDEAKSHEQKKGNEIEEAQLLKRQ